MFKPVIYCVGDSHSTFFAGRDRIQADRSWRRLIPCFRVFYLGPVLAYNLPKNGTTTGGREKFLALLGKEIPRGSWIMTVFGEIDTRAHLLGQVDKKGLSVEQVTEACAENYFSFVMELRERGYRPIVYNVVASRPDWDGMSASQKIDFPYEGTQAERNHAVRLLNKGLQRRCREQNIPFLDTFDLLVDENGVTRPECYMDEIHLSQHIMPETMERLRTLLPDLPLKLPKRYWRERERAAAAKKDVN